MKRSDIERWNDPYIRRFLHVYISTSKAYLSICVGYKCSATFRKTKNVTKKKQITRNNDIDRKANQNTNGRNALITRVKGKGQRWSMPLLMRLTLYFYNMLWEQLEHLLRINRLAGGLADVQVNPSFID